MYCVLSTIKENSLPVLRTAGYQSAKPETSFSHTQQAQKDPLEGGSFCFKANETTLTQACSDACCALWS